MESKWFAEKEKLEKMIFEDCMSYESIGRLYSCSGSNIKKVCKKILKIELPSRRIINPNEDFHTRPMREMNTCLCCGKKFRGNYASAKFCSKQCESAYKTKQTYNEFVNNPDKYQRANYTPKWIKPILLEKQNHKCAICGRKDEWEGKSLIFVLDHIDGHASHNTLDNLRLVCPNCDSQLPTFKSRNKCGERSYYRYHKNEK